jgi:hypothetical protein
VAVKDATKHSLLGVAEMDLFGHASFIGNFAVDLKPTETPRIPFRSESSGSVRSRSLLDCSMRMAKPKGQQGIRTEQCDAHPP